MNDRIPGSGVFNPIIYKGCALCINDPETPGEEWQWWIIERPEMEPLNCRTESECKCMIDDLHDMLNQVRSQ